MRMASTTYLCVAKKTLTSLGRKAFEETKVEKSRKKEREKYWIHERWERVLLIWSPATYLVLPCSLKVLLVIISATLFLITCETPRLAGWSIGFNSARVFVVSLKCEFDSTLIYVMSSGATERQISAPETMIGTSINCLCDTIRFKLQTQCPPIQNRH